MPTDSAVAAQWFEAIGTLLAVLVALVLALFHDKIRTVFIHAKLEVSIDLKPPDCQKIGLRYDCLIQGPSSMPIKTWPEERLIDTYYLRLRVINSGNQKAEHVEVFAGELLRKEADGAFRRVNSFLPMNLVWSHDHTVFCPAISPGRMYRHLDLAHIFNPQQRRMVPAEDRTWPNVSPDDAILSFDTAVRPYTQSYLVPPGVYRLTMFVAAANTKPVKKTMEITVTGKWYDDEEEMLRQGIGVTPLD